MKTNKNNNSSLVPVTKDTGVSVNTNQPLSLFDSIFNSDFWFKPLFPTLYGIKEYSDKLELTIPLPNFKKEEITVLTMKNGVEVSAKNKNSSYFQTYSYSGLNYPKTTSKFDNGNLVVTIQKLPVEKTEVKVE